MIGGCRFRFAVLVALAGFSALVYTDLTTRSYYLATSPSSLPTGRAAPTATSTNDGFALPDEVKICRIRDPKPEFGGPKLTEETSFIMGLVKNQFRYQCAGPPYEHFMNDHVFPFVLQRYEKTNTSLQWGKRPSLFPPTPVAAAAPQNHSILIVGNSHTRQLAETLMCEYLDELQFSQKLAPPGSGQIMLQYQLTGNNTVWVVVNPAIVYSNQWQSNLERLMRFNSLSELDAIVLGMFNPYHNEFGKSSMWKGIIRYGEQHPELNVNVTLHHHPFRLADLARIYKGPIIWASMFAEYGKYEHQRAVKDKAKFVHRTNIQTINARRYIKDLKGVECGAYPVEHVSTCVDDPNDRKYRNNHLCMGALGSYVDLIAWDVVEALWAALAKN